MNSVERATQLLGRFMDEERRDRWLTLAFFSEYRDVYDAIKQQGATA